MGKSQKIIVFQCILICVFFIYLAYRIYQGANTDTRNEIEWGVRNSDATFTNRKDKDIGIETAYVFSHVNPDLITAFYTADGTWLRSIDGECGDVVIHL